MTIQKWRDDSNVCGDSDSCLSKAHLVLLPYEDLMRDGCMCAFMASAGMPVADNNFMSGEITYL
jgi:hypothetical protein